MTDLIDDPAARIRDLARQASYLTGNSADAEDLAQEAITRALTYAKDGRSVRNWRGYLYRILRNVRADHVGRQARRGPMVAIDDVEHLLSVPAPQPSELLLRELGEALERLPESQRQVLRLVGVDGLSYQDTALALQIPVGTVMSRLHRGRGALRRAIGDEPDTAGPSAEAVALELPAEPSGQEHPGEPQVADQRPQRVRECLRPVALDKGMADPGRAVADQQRRDGEPPVGAQHRARQKRQSEHGAQDMDPPCGRAAVLAQIPGPELLVGHDR